jgi:predicted outer membrane repeat protein
MKSFFTTFLSITFVLVSAAHLATAQTTRYVKPTATGSGSGANWANASNDLQAMLNASAANDAVWVAAGTYFPTQASDLSNARTKTFLLKDGVKLYGGFVGTETLLSQRILLALGAAGGSVLSGDIGTPNDATDNVFHVVLAISTSAATVLDGFTISAGNTDIFVGSEIINAKAIMRTNGGGLYNESSQMTMRNLCFKDNKGKNGAGMYNSASAGSLNNALFLTNTATTWGGGLYNNTATTTFDKVVFNANAATTGAGAGGGVFNQAATTVFTNCDFVNNNSKNGGGMYNFQASNVEIKSVGFSNNVGTFYGGGLYNDASITNLTNVVFSENTTTAQGGGIYNDNGNGSFTNVTISKNSATNSGGGIFNNNNSKPTIKNSIIWGNTGGGVVGIANIASVPVVSYSIVESPAIYAGVNNSNTDPLFVNAANPKGADGVLRTADDGIFIDGCSPAIDAARNTGAPTMDILENSTYNVVKDMGAYERQTELICPIYQNNTGCQTLTLDNVQGDQWFYFKNSSGIVAAINPNGSHLGTVTVEVSDATGAIAYNTAKFLGRTVNVTSSAYPNSATIPLNYSLRLYYFNTELDEYNAATGNNSNLADMNMAWKSGGTGGCTLASYGNGNNGLLDKNAITESEYGASGEGFSLNFDLNHFTIFAATASSGNPLPVKLLSFAGQAIDKTNELNWATATEQNASHFEIETTTTDFANWKKISTVSAENAQNGAAYTYTDQAPSAGRNYYRLKMVDFDGSFEYSNTISIAGRKSIAFEVEKVYPNPTAGDLNVLYNAKNTDNVAFEVFDALNRLVYSTSETPQIGSNTASIDMRGFTNGVYYLTIANANGVKITRKVVKM